MGVTWRFCRRVVVGVFPAQLWLIDRGGGEAQVVTSFKGDVLDYDWSPDGKRIALIVMDEDPGRVAEGEKKTPPPIVIDRYYFKEDETGYLGALRPAYAWYRHGYAQGRAADAGQVRRSLARLVPRRIADCVRQQARTGSGSQQRQWSVRHRPRPGSKARLVATFHGDSGDSGWMTRPSWRPDGRQIVLSVARDPAIIYYARQDLMIVNVAEGQSSAVNGALDRNVFAPRWSGDGKWIHALIEDDHNQHLARVIPRRRARACAGRSARNPRIDSGPRPSRGARQHRGPARSYGGRGRQAAALSRQNDPWLAGLQLATGRGDQSHQGRYPDPRLCDQAAGFVSSRRYPTILQIHGGPVSQYSNGFMPIGRFSRRPATSCWRRIRAAARARPGIGQGDLGRMGHQGCEDVLGVVDGAVNRGSPIPNASAWVAGAMAACSPTW